MSTMRKTIILVCASIFFNFQFSALNSLWAQDSVLTVSLSDGIAIEMVYVEGGTFTMGNRATPKGIKLTYDASRPEHKVAVRNFFIGRHEVTQAQWQAVMGSNPSNFVGDSLPVEQVSWDDAQQFCAMLSQITGLRFRLPTEAEWEYAARGGRMSKRHVFAGGNNRDNYVWYCVNSGGHTHPVGQLQPNELGLYDMCGNVAEWCSDWMAPYSDMLGDGIDVIDNPRGPSSGDSRVLRGGHYNSTSPACTVYDRGWYLPSGRYEFYGLRIVMDPPEPDTEENDEE